MKYSEIKNRKIKIEGVVKTLDKIIKEVEENKNCILTDDEKLVYGLLFLTTKTNYKE